MKINVGSQNQNKVRAVEEALAEFPEYKNSKVEGLEVDSGVSNQPKSIEETLDGAMNRAKNAFKNCDYSVGLEAGLMKMPHTKSGYVDVTMCAIYDGKRFHLGGSSIFEYPKSMVDLIFSKNYEVDEAAYEIGITDNVRIGKANGMIDLLTKGRITRKDYTKEAVTNALIHLINPEHY
jgi:inosine/xanthosine triphosphatase